MENVFLRKKQGFTLIEILVVIAIIGSLATLGLGSYVATLKNGRNARRRGDLKAIQNAWEQYYADNTAYPSTCSVPSTYLPAVPTDPINSDPYKYVFIYCSPNSYTICATLESDPQSQYCVNSLQ